MIDNFVDDAEILAEILKVSRGLRSRKYRVHCDACGNDASYTWKRLKKAICRNCNAPLSIAGLSYRKAQMALCARRVPTP
jgi:RNase P subunit RPR2